MRELFLEQNNKTKALVLCSSGLDSVYNLLKAKQEFTSVSVAFFDYSQKAVAQEYVHVRKLCQALKLDFIKVDLPWYRNLDSSLLSKKTEISKYASLKDADSSSTLPEWVPNRNGVFVNIGAAIAESKSYQVIIMGLNKEEAVRFPDNTETFMNRSNSLFEFSTLSKPKVFSYSVDMVKNDIYDELCKTADLLGIKNIQEYIWSCYDSYEKMCGSCESCLRLKRVIKEHRQESEWKDRFLR